MPDDAAVRRHLSFLEDAQTSRKDVLIRLGQPRAVFEDEQVLIYWLWYDASTQEITPVLSDLPFASDAQLVVVFDESGRLVQHRLIGTRSSP